MPRGREEERGKKEKEEKEMATTTFFRCSIREAESKAEQSIGSVDKKKKIFPDAGTSRRSEIRICSQGRWFEETRRISRGLASDNEPLRWRNES